MKRTQHASRVVASAGGETIDVIRTRAKQAVEHFLLGATVKLMTIFAEMTRTLKTESGNDVLVILALFDDGQVSILSGFNDSLARRVLTGASNFGNRWG